MVKPLHQVLESTGDAQAAISSALAICRLMDIDHSSDAFVAGFLWHHDGVQTFVKMLGFREPAAKRVRLCCFQEPCKG